jgi:magnesium chelatase family protein
VAARVTAARLAQAERWGPVLGTRSPVNADVPGAVLRAAPWRPAAAVTATLDRALETGSLSLRGYDRSLRVAWTVADIARLERPEREQVDLALSLRHRQGVAA